MTQTSEAGRPNEQKPERIIDTRAALGTWYGTPDAIGIQTLQYAHFLGRPVGIGRSIVSKEQVEYPKKLPMVDKFEADIYGNLAGIVDVTPEKARGHLNETNGFPLILPGHKQIRSAVETVQTLERMVGNSYFSRLKSFDLAQFSRPVLADGSHTLHIAPKLVKRTQETAVYNVKIANENGDDTATISNLIVSYMHDREPAVLPEDFIIEAAAQTAGATLLPPESFEGEIVPLFGQVGPVEFSGVTLEPGAAVEYYAVGESSKRGIEGKLIRVISNGKDIATIGGVQAVIGSKKTGK